MIMNKIDQEYVSIDKQYNTLNEYVYNRSPIFSLIQVIDNFIQVIVKSIKLIGKLIQLIGKKIKLIANVIQVIGNVIQVIGNPYKGMQLISKLLGNLQVTSNTHTINWYTNLVNINL